MTDLKFQQGDNSEASGSSPEKKVQKFDGARIKARELEKQQALERERLKRQEETESNRPNILTGENMSSQNFLKKVNDREATRKAFFSGARFSSTKWKQISKEYIMKEYVETMNRSTSVIHNFSQREIMAGFNITGLYGKPLDDHINSKIADINTLRSQFLQKGTKNRLEIAEKLAVHSDYLEYLEWRTTNHQNLRYTDMLSDEARGDVYRRIQDKFSYRSFVITNELTHEKGRKIDAMLGDITVADTSTVDFVKEHRSALRELKKQQADKQSDFSKEIEKYNSAAREFGQERDNLTRQGSNLTPNEYKERAAQYVQLSKDIFEFEKTLRARIAAIEAEPESVSPNLMQKMGALDLTNPEHWNQARRKQSEIEPFSDDPQPIPNEWWK